MELLINPFPADVQPKKQADMLPNFLTGIVSKKRADILRNLLCGCFLLGCLVGCVRTVCEGGIDAELHKYVDAGVAYEKGCAGYKVAVVLLRWRNVRV